MIPTGYRENESCSNCEHRIKDGWVYYCGHDGSKLPDQMTVQWMNDHIVSEDGVCDEWEEQ